MLIITPYSNCLLHTVPGIYIYILFFFLGGGGGEMFP